MKLFTLGIIGILALPPLSAEAAPQLRCAAVEAAISASEDFVDPALSSDQAAKDNALKKLGESISLIEPLLQQPVAQDIKFRLASLTAAKSTGKNPTAALDSLEIYRALVTSYQRCLPTILDIAMLDYAGLRLKALASADTVDWEAIAQTVKASDSNWATINTKLHNQVLGELATNVREGVAAATMARSGAWLMSLASIQLDAVDLMEKAIKKAPAELRN